MSKHSVVGVRIDNKNGIRASFSDEYHCPGDKVDSDAADKISREAKKAIAEGTSPMYLVDAAFAKEVAEMSRGKSALSLSSCRKGQRGKPCGKCRSCRKARVEFVTHAILNGVALPKSYFAESVKDAVSDVIGGVVFNMGWVRDMAEGESKEVIVKLKDITK